MLEDDFITSEELKKFFGIKEWTLCFWIRERDFPKPIKIGKKRVWNRKKFNKWLEQSPDFFAKRVKESK